MSFEPGAPPPPRHVAIGVLLWLGLAGVALVFMEDEPRGNRIFLGCLVALCIGFAAWRSVVLVRAVRSVRPDDAPRIGPHFHVSSTLNRDSIEEFGLDSARMGAAPGIAGSRAPEMEGCFVTDSEFEVNWLLEMNNTGGPADVWRIDGLDGSRLLDNGDGFFYYLGRIPRQQLTLVRSDVPRDSQPD